MNHSESQTTAPFQPEWLNLSTSLAPYKSQLGLVGLLGILLCLSLLKKPRRQQAKARFASFQEKFSAQSLARKQRKQGIYNKTALRAANLNLPNAHQSIGILGAPGSGKTYSAVEPLIYYGLEQGYPIVTYDFKYPKQTSRLVAEAKRLGYEVHIICSGAEESQVFNPLDFLQNSSDMTAAYQMAQTLFLNFLHQQKSGGDDSYFEQAGSAAIMAGLLFAKATDFPDIMTTYALFSLTDLDARLQSISYDSHWDYWLNVAFKPYLSVIDSPRTAASIRGMVTLMLSRFMTPDLLATFCGETSIPTHLTGKQLVILGVNRLYRDLHTPLMAMVLEILITQNISGQRHEPLMLVLDELPTLRLPRLVNWLNESREDGLITIWAAQNLAQLKYTYGDDISRAIFGASGSKIMFNPQDYESAKLFSDYLGDEEIENPTVSYNRGRNFGTTLGKEYRTRALVESREFLSLSQGEAIVINSGYRNRRETALPFRHRFVLSKQLQKRRQESEDLWGNFSEEMKALSPQILPTSDELKSREAMVQELLPLAVNSNAVNSDEYMKL